jgi:hypothetical protein
MAKSTSLGGSFITGCGVGVKRERGVDFFSLI